MFKKNPDPSQSFVAPITSPAQARKSTAGLVETSKEKLIKRPESGASNSKLGKSFVVVELHVQKIRNDAT